MNPRRIRTFHARRGRRTPTQARALDLDAPRFAPTSSELRAPRHPTVLEIGCGDGAAAVAYARAHPTSTVVAYDVYPPGVAALVQRLAQDATTNVRVAVGDAVEVLDRDVGSGALHGIHAFFPDPWPKARHHKRRLLRPDLLDLFADRLGPGGHLLTATDWPDYARQIDEVVGGHAAFAGGRSSRPPWRPVTTYEAKAVAAGRAVQEFAFRRS